MAPDPRSLALRKRRGAMVRRVCAEFGHAIEDGKVEAVVTHLLAFLAERARLARLLGEPI